MSPAISLFMCALIASCGTERTAVKTDTAVNTNSSGEQISVPHNEASHMTTIADISFTSITGEPIPSSLFNDKAVLIVNTASRCGYTPQYKGLQDLWTRYGDKGLVVLGIPSNDFGGQEPGTEADVKLFCEINYGVTFPLTQKETVTGPGAHPFFALASDTLGDTAQPKWNFHKVLVGKDGRPLQAFTSSVKPGDAELTQAIEAALAS